MDVKSRIELFGGLRALRGDVAVTRFRTQKTGSLLAYLAFYPHKIHYRENLIEILWPGVAPEAGRNSLSVALSSLRQLLEPTGVAAGSVLRADRFTVQIEPAALSTDVADFEEALRAPEELDASRRAVELYRGALLSGYYEEWIGLEQQRFAEQFCRAVQRLLAHLQQADSHHEALDYARRAAAVDPLREEFHIVLIQLLARHGRFTDAMRQYREMERLLDQQLGAMPSPIARSLLVELQQRGSEEDNKAEDKADKADRQSKADKEDKEGKADRQSRVEDKVEARQFPPLKGAVDRGNRLPVELTRFFGRENEMGRLTDMLTWEGDESSEYSPPLSRTLPLRHAPTPRLITLTGPGGSGKTRLALAVAEEMAETFSGAVWFVSLGDLTDAGRIGDVIADSLRLPRSPTAEPLEHAAEFLNALKSQEAAPAASAEQPLNLPQESGHEGKARTSWSQCAGRSLLVLDNFEQLVEDGAAILQTLLERVPALTCLVTSRRRLNLRGEQIFPVEPLPVPEDSRGARREENAGEKTGTLTQAPLYLPAQLLQYPSVALFVDRARLARGDFHLTPENEEAVAALCRRLEGIPLALELAAARAVVLSPQQMLARLSERTDLLVSRQRDIPARQRTLRAALDWSYALLAPDLQRFFAHLSVFRGGWTLEAAESVCAASAPLQKPASKSQNVPNVPNVPNGQNDVQNADVLDYLTQLGDGSLIQTKESDGGLRFRMLETLREYAAEHLNRTEQAALRQRHLAFFLAFAENAFPHLKGPEQIVWLDRLETEHDNLRVALQFCAETPDLPFAPETATVPLPDDAGLRLTGALQQFWWTRGHLTEGRKWSALALSHPQAANRTNARAKALDGAGMLARMQGDYTEARALHEAGLAINRERNNRYGIACSVNNLGIVTRQQGDYAAARVSYEESLAIHREMENKWGIAGALSNLANVAKDEGDYVSAQTLYEEALVCNRETGNRAWEAINLNGLANLAHYRGDLVTARALYEEGLAIRRESGDAQSRAVPLNSLAALAREQGDYVLARTYLAECMTLCRQLEIQYMAASCLENFAALVHAQGQPERAVSLYGTAAALRDSLGVPLSSADHKEREADLNALESTLGPAAFTAAFNAGRARDWEQVFASALKEGLT